MKKEPGISVIIPTCNRRESLSACLRALARQNHPGTDFEVVVVDDGSDPPIPNEVLTEFPGIEITLVRNSENLGPSAARNRGAACARGRYLVFTDDDCIPDRNWLAKLKTALETAPSSAVGGGFLDGGGGNLFSAASHSILETAYEHYNSPAGAAGFFATLNMAVPAREFAEIGGFRGDFRTAEDREFCARWLRRGKRMISAPDAVVVHKPLAGLRRFWRRHYHYGAGAYRFRSLQAKIGNSAMARTPARFYWRMVSTPLAKNLGWRAIAVSFLIMISQIASLLGFVRESRRGK